MIMLLCKNLRKSFKTFTHEQDVQEVRQRTELFHVTLLGFLVSRGRAAMIVLADSNEFCDEQHVACSTCDCINVV